MDPSALFGAFEAGPSASTSKDTSRSASSDEGEGTSAAAGSQQTKEERRKSKKAARKALKKAQRKEQEQAKDSDKAGASGSKADADVSQTSTTSNGTKRGYDNGASNSNAALSSHSNSTDAPPSKKVKQGSESGPEEDGSGSKPSTAAPRQAVITDAFSTETFRQIPAEGSVNGAQQENGKVSQPGIIAESSLNGAQGEGVVVGSKTNHDVAVPDGYPYKSLTEDIAPEKPAKTYSFQLDPFQATAVACIERNESVLVAAHTSAGKTVVAEYAIAHCLNRGQRVVYTSPIKALSNQKYRDFAKEFNDVGLMTGDVTINPSASCLVMTTEILRSMLYRGSEIMREVAWVVFDEVHYMRDSERGVVWEETIILLPRKVRYVFLSATIPNAMQFAGWISTIHVQPCHIVYTDYRPTPLQQYLFPTGGDGIHLVVDEAGRFREDNFQKAMGALADGKGEDPSNVDSGKGKKGQTKKGGQKGPSDIYKIVKMIMVKNYNPVIVFAFSKKECEALALQMSKIEFNNNEEKTLVSSVFESAISNLSEEDRSLPQIEQILPLLRRGVGIHHGGLLPILKEIIELLFQEGLIKVLFATETFSIGLNMPAKTVVFTAVRKWDGKEFRNLSSGEFIQMSGRAGRRGLDDRGIVIMMFDEKLEPQAAKQMVYGSADELNSAFHLGYNMILNLMRVEGISPEYMLERCFFQYQSAETVPKLENKLSGANEELEKITVPREAETSEYFGLRKQLEDLNRDFAEVITHPTYSLPFLQPGRLVRVKHEDADFGWGCVVNHQKRAAPRGRAAAAAADEPEHNQYVVDCLLEVAKGGTIPTMKDLARGAKSLASVGVHPPIAGEESEMAVVPVLLSTVQSISGIRLILPKDLRPRDARQQVKSRLAEVMRRFPTKGENAKGIPLLDPVKDMKITDESFTSLLGKIALLEEKLSESPLHGSNELPALYQAYKKKQEASAVVENLQKELEKAHSVMQLDELKCRKRVLRRLGFASADDIVEKKGRVACEISTGDELLLTEMIFNGVFNDLTEEQCAALLSCFVFNEKSEQQIRLKEDLAGPLRVMQESARRIAKVSIESRLPINEDEYVSKFRVELMDAVMQWCKGAKFSDIIKLTDVFEGSIIRAFRRLQELLRQMVQAAKAIGNEELENKFSGALDKLERQGSIIFSPSLYL